MMDRNEIGQKIRVLRERKSLTLDKLADYTGYSKSYLSRIENSKKIPSISTLTRISQALSVNVVDLFPNRKAKTDNVGLSFNLREEMAEQSGHEHNRQLYRALASEKTDKTIKPYLVIAGSGKNINPHHKHEGEEFIYVLEGKLEFFFDDKSRIFEEGDSLLFDASTAHFGRSVGKEKTKLLIIIYEPTKPF